MRYKYKKEQAFYAIISMNILFYLSHTASPKHGGIANVTLALCRNLEILGHKAYVLSACKTQEDMYYRQLYLPNAVVEMCDENGDYFKFIVNKYAIDIVVNQNGTTPKCIAPITWSNRIKIPIVSVFHNSLIGLYGINGKMTTFHPIMKRLGVYCFVNIVVNRLFKFKYGRLYSLMSKQSTQLVTLSDKFYEEVRWFSNNKDCKLAAIPNPLTIELPINQSFTKENELLFVGRLSTEKRVDLLLTIWSQLYKRFPDWRLTIVGDGPCRDTMIDRAKKLALERCIFEGFQNPLPYYNRAKIFCMTSAFEGFGLVLIEAMAYGVVPLAFHSYANVVDIIEDGVSGYIIPPFKTDEYVEKLAYLMSDNDSISCLQKSAVQKAMEFSGDKIAQKWIDLFDNILSR